MIHLVLYIVQYIIRLGPRWRVTVFVFVHPQTVNFSSLIDDFEGSIPAQGGATCQEDV